MPSPFRSRRSFPQLLCMLMAFSMAVGVRADETNEADVPSRTDVYELIRANKPVEAAAALEKALANDPESMSLQTLRTTLAIRLANAGDYPAGVEQMRELAEFLMEKEPGHALLPNTLSTMMSLAARAGQSEQAAGLVEQAYENSLTLTDLKGLQHRGALLSVKARLMSSAEDSEGTLDWVLTEVADLRTKLGAMDDPAARLAEIDILQTAAGLARTEPDQLAELNEEMNGLLMVQLEAAPEDANVLNKFGQIRTTQIAMMYRDAPEEAREILQETLERLEGAKLEDNRMLQSTIARIRGYERRIDSALLLQELIGQQAPPLDAAAWAHGTPLSDGDLKGKVVLLDFWAVWCGPCIATFPHLQEWHEEFHEQGLEIVGVTRKYGYEWNEEVGRASRAENSDEITMEQELAMLEKFMDHHELHHATIVTPDGSEMQGAYGVSGIPQAVLIDRSGKVRMIKVGSGEANATALHDMIQTLLAETAE